MNNKRRGIFFLGILVLLLLAACGGKRVSGLRENTGQDVIADDTTRTTDVMMVMDESGSMLHSDPDRFAIEGAKMFVDMEKAAGMNLGLVEFSNRVNTTGLLDMGDGQNRASMKAVLEGIVYDPPAHTDTGWGLLKAEEVLSGMPEKDRKIILLFTDGQTDIDAGTPGRTTEDSKRDVDTAIQQAQEHGYEIYCIGLNADGNVDEGELSKIALSTSANYHIANSVQELPDFYNSIIAEIGGSEALTLNEYTADGEYHTEHFTVESSRVMEANIILLSGVQVEDIQVTAPSGEAVNLGDESKARYTASRTYSLVKLFYPEIGEWTVNVKGVQGDQIKIGMIYSYNMDLKVHVDCTRMELGGSVYIEASLYSGEEKVTDEALYQGLSGYASIVSREDGSESRIDLNLSGNMLGSVYRPEKEGTYDCTVHVEGNGFFRDSPAIELNVTGEPAEITKKIGKVYVRKGKQIEKDLDLYFSDPQGNGLSYEVEGTDSKAAAEIKDGHILVITGKEKGQTWLTVGAKNASGIAIGQQIRIRVETAAGMIRRVAIPVLVALLILWLIWRKTKGGERVTGVLDDIFVEYTGPDPETGTSKSERYQIPCNMELRSLGKRGATADKLLQILKGYYSAYGTEVQKEAFIRAVDTFKEEASHVRISGSKQPYTIKLTKTGNHVRLLPFDGEKQTISLNEGSGYNPVMKHEQRIGFQFDKYGKEDTTVPEETLVVSMNYKRI